MFDAKIFLEHYGIAHTNKDPKHSRTGWVQIKCPYCQGSHGGWHGGFCISGGYYTCWRCGGHWLPKVIATITGVGLREAKEIVKQYSSGDPGPRFKTRKYLDKLKPPETQPLTPIARKYLENRGYDPDKLAAIWEIKSTKHTGDYSFRIFIPIFHNRQMVSFTTRGISSQQNPKYKSCPDDQEIYHHKFCLYGADKIEGDSCLAVEGPADAWRMGIGAVATFGIKYSEPQVNLLSKFKQVFILFDPEDQAQLQADKLHYQLTARGIECQILQDNKGRDPGEFGQQEADEIMQSLF